MNLFRSVLFWLVLAVLGALLAQLLLQDPGYVLVRFRGTDYQATVAAGLGLLLAFMFGVTLLWNLLRLPFVAWKRRRERRARAQLIDGLHAHQRGEYQRAEQLLKQAAAHGEGGNLARIHAARAAAARGDDAAATAHLDALGERDATSQALLRAEHALARSNPADALAALDAPRAQPLPPRGLQLRADALAASGRSFDAYGLLGALRQQQALPAARLDELQSQWAAQSLQQAGNASELADRWDALPQGVQTSASVVAAYARRAAAMGWNEAATRSLEQALDRQWDEDLADLYGQLDVARLEERRTQAERWLQAHPSSPALLLAVARLDKAQGHLPQAERALYRAIAQGAGSPAWEALGDIAVQSGDEPRARLAYANALRSQRSATLLDMPGRDLRQQIADTAAIEERNEHGIPRLRG
ncbi:heme biosynthesis HemY N-terminal domain-containing protein [Thermomonas sp.]|uniref:heme biosynthesis HemY N-terminal domain-containing protein n=1 Tax=Thermomonas sp. TaxID=1971895 RepID=UPI002488AE2D|nr:heme biosynthesis HemY N-terminal domain-containing protein [Thermomonas sp.]MDI1252401.1 heme biosynthesis HemY N-terminal domain-containing protein [Thermomonas sp.]